MGYNNYLLGCPKCGTEAVTALEAVEGHKDQAHCEIHGLVDVEDALAKREKIPMPKYPGGTTYVKSFITLNARGG